MLLVRFFMSCIFILSVANTLEFPGNTNSDMSGEEKEIPKENGKTDQSGADDSAHEIETDIEEKDKKFLDDALIAVLDPHSIIDTSKDKVEIFKKNVEKVEQENNTIDLFIQEMDNISLEICKTSQEALWSYVTDTTNESKKNNMIRIAAEDDEIKKQYWNILKKHYLNDSHFLNDTKLQRKLRIIKERAINVLLPQSKQRQEIDTMQSIWSRVAMCAYNDSSCKQQGAVRTMSDVISIFKTSNDSEELSYYWKAYRDATGMKIRPIFKDYILKVNEVAISENYTDAGEMWRYTFEVENFVKTVDRIWSEIKPMYDLLHDYVRAKLKKIYPDEFNAKENSIPAHILGNLWAQEWQPIYSKVAPYPDLERPRIRENLTLSSKELFDVVDEFHQSLGFESANESYQDIAEFATTSNCLPSSHDMCDGLNYKVKWCGGKVIDAVIGLSKAARLLGHVQYFKHYRNLLPLFRDGPNPSFHDAISDITAVQITSPEYLSRVNFVKSVQGPEATVNNLLWLALEKFPLMGYAYVLDKWRWDVFGNTSLENWNQHWWDLRLRETGVSPPVERSEADLDPAAKYHVVSHVQYITYLISHVLEFQILRSLCKRVNHTGPLNECSLYGKEEAGKLLSAGMSLGASEDWRTVLETMTGERELYTEGINQYFEPLKAFLKQENERLNKEDLIKNTSVTIIVGIALSVLVFIIIVAYFVKKNDVGGKFLSICGLSKNGSLDIVTDELNPKVKVKATDGFVEEKF